MQRLIALMVFGLTGCSVGHYEYSKEAEKRVDMTVTGIPTVLGLGTLGTTIPLTPEYSLTAAHVAKFSLYRVKAWHPQCDLAVVYHKNSEMNLPPNFRNSHIGDQVNLYGYSFISAMPVSSSGQNLINTTLANSWNKSDCVVVAANAGVIKGMSGGAVYNASDDTLAGVIIGYSNNINDNVSGKTLYKNVALYVPYSRFQTWLDQAIKS
ncbi:trypsin-like peptidase domain-containing protein [Pantoea agglomerans]|uniref:trypsin-like peptidase domain-containing protein n=1 Tax=Enterobacter agglomerans TaxID=549 RepID=UPI0007E55D59|nr:trypsin-like peptidase domain-containing protein [Pantoea agglomerans]WHU88172.1 trypsin-like peptidase domain-containing protein [Pantoea agglomerans pv. gypsophilae]